MSEKANPALELHAILREWATATSGASILSQRGGEHWWANHVRAIELLNYVESHLDQQSPTVSRDDADRSVEQDVLNRLKHAIFSTSLAMKSSPTSDVQLLSPIDVDYLRQIGRGWQSTAIDPAATRELKQIVSQLLGFIERADVADDSKRYLFELGVSLQRMTAEITVFGAADIKALADQLIGALSVAFKDFDDPDQKQEYVSIWKRLVAESERLWEIFSESFAKAVGTGLATGVVACAALPPSVTPIK
jgi:hypothetical protein